MAAREREGNVEAFQRFLGLLSPEELLAGLSPEQRVAGLSLEERIEGLSLEERIEGLAPEQLLAGLSPDQILPALPLEVLRLLPAEYVASLPEPTREAIRIRLGR